MLASASEIEEDEAPQRHGRLHGVTGNNGGTGNQRGSAGLGDGREDGCWGEMGRPREVEDDGVGEMGRRRERRGARRRG